MSALKTQTVPALDRALSILELLSHSRSGLSLPEIVKQSGMPRSSVHYLVVTLERRGYVQKDERTTRYMFGMNLVNLASAAVNGLSLRHLSSPFLQALMRRTQLTVHMGVLSASEAVLIAKHTPLRGGRLATWVGKRMDIHCTALGKALGAHLPDADLDNLLQEHGLPRHNDNTIATSRKLRDDFTNILRLGYAVDDEEDEVGFRCIGVPVVDGSGRARAAISLAGGSEEISDSNFDSLVRETKKTAAELGAALIQSEAPV